MTKIISSTSLRNEYNAVSSWCHENDKAAFVTKNGMGDLAIMSVSTYDDLCARASLYSKLPEGRADALADRMGPVEAAVEQTRQDILEYSASDDSASSKKASAAVSNQIGCIVLPIEGDAELSGTRYTGILPFSSPWASITQ